MDDNSLPSLLVKFRFDGKTKHEIVILTYEQYSNLKALPITTECKIVKNQEPTMSQQDMDKINKKLATVFAKSRSHMEMLSK